MIRANSHSLADSGVRVLGPTTVAMGETVVVLGRVGVEVLAMLAPGQVAAEDVQRQVWGDPQGSGARLRQAMVRINRKLAAAGWRWRIRLDAGQVLLMPEPTAPPPVSAA